MPYHLQQMSYHLNVHNIWKVHWSTLEDVLSFKLKSLSPWLLTPRENVLPLACQRCYAKMCWSASQEVWYFNSASVAYGPLSLSVHDLQEMSYHLHVQYGVQKSVLKYVAHRLVLQWSYSDFLLVCSCFPCRFGRVPPTYKSQEMMKTCQTSIKQSNPKKKERERYKIEGPKCRPKERTTNKGRWQGGHEKIKSLNPGNISDEEREGTPERTLSLQEPPTTNSRRGYYVQNRVYFLAKP